MKNDAQQLNEAYENIRFKRPQPIKEENPFGDFAAHEYEEGNSFEINPDLLNQLDRIHDELADLLEQDPDPEHATSLTNFTNALELFLQGQFFIENYPI